MTKVLERIIQIARRGTMFAALLVVTILATPSNAQCEGQWLPADRIPAVTGYDGTIKSMVVSDIEGPTGPEHVLVVAGSFNMAGDVRVGCIAAWNGTAWRSVGHSLTIGHQSYPGLLGSSRVVAVFRGELIAGTSYYAGGPALVHLVGDEWIPLGTNGPTDVHALLVMGEQLFAGGSFGVMRWDGSAWTSIDTISVGVINSLVNFDGSLVAGGTASFPAPTDGGPAATTIARWDGMNWRPFAGNTLRSAVASLCAYQGDLIAGLSYPSQQVFRLSAGVWGLMGPNNPVPGSLGLQTGAVTVFDGQLFATGLIRWPCNRSATARWETTGWHCLPSSGVYWGYSFAEYNHQLVVGGTRNLNGGGFARWTNPTADFNHDGDVGNDADIEAFFTCLAGNCCVACGTADINGDGDVGTDQDIEAFFRLLAGGAC